MLVGCGKRIMGYGHMTGLVFGRAGLSNIKGSEQSDSLSWRYMI